MAGGGGTIPYMYIFLYIRYLQLLGSHNDVSVLSKSVMGLKKTVLIGGGWVV